MISFCDFISSSRDFIFLKCCIIAGYWQVSCRYIWTLIVLCGFVFQMPSHRSARSKRPSSQALESLVASPPRRRRPAAHNSAIVPPVPAAQPVKPAPPVHAVQLVEPAPPVPAIEPAVPAFPPALFAQLVQQVAAEVTKQLQPTSSSPTVQGPQAASAASASFPGMAGTTSIQQLTTEVPVVNSLAVDSARQPVPAGNASVVDPVAQVVQSVHS